MRKTKVIKPLLLFTAFYFLFLFLFSPSPELPPPRNERSRRSGREIQEVKDIGFPEEGGEKLSVLLLITSSRLPESEEMRRTVRETWLNLAAPFSNQIHLEYRFLLGEQREPSLLPSLESLMYKDLLELPVDDSYQSLSRKIYAALEWSTQFEFDFLFKTDEDCFLRLDVILKEILALKGRKGYWSGLVYRNMPKITQAWNKNVDPSYQGTTYPPFTAGAFYILSRDLVAYVTSPPKNGADRIFTKNEDQNLGIWLQDSGVEPVHDRRIQQWHVCDEDLIVKHFYGDFQDLSMREMYDNLKRGKEMCHGFSKYYCPACYDCSERGSNWEAWGYSCDPVLGLSLDISKTSYVE